MDQEPDDLAVVVQPLEDPFVVGGREVALSESPQDLKHIPLVVVGDKHGLGNRRCRPAAIRVRHRENRYGGAGMNQRKRSAPAWRKAWLAVRYIVLNALFPCCLLGATAGSVWMLAQAVQVGTGLKPSAGHRAECARMVEGRPLREATVHRYQGRVTDRTRGSFGVDSPLYHFLESDLVLAVDGGDLLFIDRRSGASPAPRRAGDVYTFCGVARERLALWPIVGYRGGLFGGPVHEALDDTRYQRVLWVSDLPDQRN